MAADKAKRFGKEFEKILLICGANKPFAKHMVRELEENDNIFIPQGDLHRLENVGEKALKLIEIQIGDKISEDDIERLEDDFGRI